MDSSSWWSVAIMNSELKWWHLKSSVAQMTATALWPKRISSSLVLYFCSAEFKNRLAYEIGKQTLESYCSSVAPRPLWLPSHFTPVRFSLSKSFCSVISSIWFLMLFSASVCYSDHCILLFMMFSFFSRDLIGSSRLARLGMNFIS